MEENLFPTQSAADDYLVTRDFKFTHVIKDPDDLKRAREVICNMGLTQHQFNIARFDKGCVIGFRAQYDSGQFAPMMGALATKHLLGKILLQKPGVAERDALGYNRPKPKHP